ncbi:MAG: PRC-barrel domain containing protein, partial [Cytophagaceae bacterium]
MGVEAIVRLCDKKIATIKGGFMNNIKRDENSTPSQTQSWGRLMRLADTQLAFANPQEDIRGHRVVGPNQREIGYVRALMVDEVNPRIHFLEVAFGGILGMGETAYLVPVDLVTQVQEDAVFVARTREQISASPRYEPQLRDLSPDDIIPIMDYYG